MGLESYKRYQDLYKRNYLPSRIGFEEMARTLFKSWFVDFDPVRAKMEGRQPAGIDDEVAALFPDSLEESLLGEIPKGGSVEPLHEVAHLLNELALQKYPPEGDEFLPAIMVAELRKGVTVSSGHATTKVPPQYVVKYGDVLFSCGAIRVRRAEDLAKGAA